MELVRDFRNLEVFKLAFSSAMDLHERSKRFPPEERYAFSDQIRRSSRSVCSNLAEGWRKRRYKAAFISKLSDAEAEAAETQVWIDFAQQCGYLQREDALLLNEKYHMIIGKLVRMIHGADAWLIR